MAKSGIYWKEIAASSCSDDGFASVITGLGYIFLKSKKKKWLQSIPLQGFEKNKRGRGKA